MVRNLNKCRRKMLPVMAYHLLFGRDFDITGKQNATPAVIDPNHAGTIVSLMLACRQRPKRLKSKPSPAPGFPSAAREMSTQIKRATNNEIWPRLNNRIQATAMIKMFVAQDDLQDGDHASATRAR